MGSRPVGQVRSQCPALVGTEPPVLLAGLGLVTAGSLGPAPARTARSSAPRGHQQGHPRNTGDILRLSLTCLEQERTEKLLIYLCKILCIHIHSYEIIKYNPL